MKSRTGQVLSRLRWWALDYIYAGRRQLEATVRRSAPPAYTHGDRTLPAIILLPGVYENWLFLEPAARRLNARGFRVFAIPALGPNLRPVADSAALVTRELATLSALHGFSRCILLAHSKGGLIGKRLMLDAPGAAQNPPPTAEVLGMVAVATPFSGSAYARYVPGRSMRDFLPTDAVLLAMQGQAGLNHKIVSIYPVFDPHIPGGSALAGAANIELPVSGHFRALAEPTVVAAVEHAVVELAQQQGRERGGAAAAG